MALGARAATVVRMVLRQGLAVGACGVGAGLMLTWLTVGILNAFFSGAGSSAAPDPTGGSQISVQIGTDFFGGHAFTALVIAVLIVMTLAAYLPARRVMRVDPNVALRME
jgi:ABC-type antimicrobial peptide transport system permease subunit